MFNKYNVNRVSDGPSLNLYRSVFCDQCKGSFPLLHESMQIFALASYLTEFYVFWLKLVCICMTSKYSTKIVFGVILSNPLI